MQKTRGLKVNGFESRRATGVVGRGSWKVDRDVKERRKVERRGSLLPVTREEYQKIHAEQGTRFSTHY